MNTNRMLSLARLAILAVAILGWELGAQSGWVNENVVSSPTDILLIIGEWTRNGTLVDSVGSTMLVIFGGFLVGVVLGVSLGSILALTGFASQVIEPFVGFFNSIPRILLLPFFVIWLGFGHLPKILVVAFVIIFVVAVHTATALRGVSVKVVENVRLLGGGRADLARLVYLPAISGRVIGSSRVTLNTAIGTAVVSEFIGATKGLGALISVGQNTFDVSVVMAGVVVVVGLALVLQGVLTVLQRRATRWVA
jgi:NitT/TauT family transport system permease protein